MPILVKKFETSESAISTYVAEVADLIIKSFVAGKDFHLLTTGGGSGNDFGNRLGAKLSSMELPAGEAKLHLWWSDERFEEHSSKDRTDSQVLDSFAPISARVFAHRSKAPSETSIELSAQALASELQSFLGDRNFDYAILGFGNDGHLASCFPEDEKTLHSEGIALAITDSPKPPKERTTFTLRQLAKSEHLVIFALGSAKKEALITTLAGTGKYPVEILSSFNPNLEVILATDLID